MLLTSIAIPNQTARALLVGKSLYVAEEHFGRGGEHGTVVEAFADGVALDFFCDIFGDPKGYPSIEMWGWDELDQEHLYHTLEWSAVCAAPPA